MKIEFTLKSSPFDWNDNFSEVAIEDFDGIRDKLSYGTCQSIGMALAKLELLEKQGCKVKPQESEPKTGHWIGEENFDGSIWYMCDNCKEFEYVNTNYCPNCGTKMEVSE